MARSDEGEFELVLGNRQLVSVFLIVVILLGVFFSMGYIVGRNATPSMTVAAQPQAKPPIVVDNPSGSAASDPAPTATPAAEPSPEPVKEPAREEPKPKPTQVTREKPTPAGPPSTEQPSAGQTFLQVVATTRPDAEIIAESLSKKGFQTTITAGPNALFRVLVGPVNGAAELAETRVRLEAVGFKPYVRRY